MKRKTIALRWLAAALVLLAVVSGIYDSCYLLPFQAIRHTEERVGTGRTESIYTKLDDWGMIAVTANEDMLLFHRLEPTLLGWENFHRRLECWEEAAFYGGWATSSYGGRPRIPYAYGRVDDAEIAEIRFSFQHGIKPEGELWAEPPMESYLYSTFRSDWIERDGHTYFVLRVEPLGPGHGREVFTGEMLTALNENGDIVAQIGGETN